jgi:hypothetical protein
MWLTGSPALPICIRPRDATHPTRDGQAEDAGGLRRLVCECLAHL